MYWFPINRRLHLECILKNAKLKLQDLTENYFIKLLLRFMINKILKKIISTLNSSHTLLL